MTTKIVRYILLVPINNLIIYVFVGSYCYLLLTIIVLAMKLGVLGPPIKCFCEVVTEAVPARTPENYDRKFYGCGKYHLRRAKECNFFIWKDQVLGA